MIDVHCIPVSGQNWRRANDVVIGQGIKYLRNNNLVCGVNPHSCSRVSCSYDSAIWVCNNVSAFCLLDMQFPNLMDIVLE